MYDENHNYLLASTNPETAPRSKRKGIYQRLLCKECDNLIIGLYEDYAARVLFQETPPVTRTKNAFIYDQIDYEKFKLYQISLLWRTSLSRRSEIVPIDLGPHGEAMRKMLLEGNPGKPHKYGTILTYIPDYTEKMVGFILPPEPVPNKVRGHRAYRAIFNGLFWIYIVSNHSETYPYQDVFISERGRLPVINSGRFGKRFVESLAQRLTKNES